ncbi:hypothetical protein FQN50_009639, partial [Emmonsiellopsis sp. PD_5]
MNINDSNNDDSDDTAFNFSGETDLMDPANYRKDVKNDISNLTDLLMNNKHPP